MKQAFLGMALLALVVACGGDNTANFVGTYNLTGTRTFSGQITGTQQLTGAQTISKSAIAGKIVIAGSDCSPTATVTTSTSFTLDQYTCPAAPITGLADSSGNSCGTCQITASYTGGSGSLVGTTLTLNATGNYSIGSCTACTGSLSGSFTDALTGNKQ